MAIFPCPGRSCNLRRWLPAVVALLCCLGSTVLGFEIDDYVFPKSVPAALQSVDGGMIALKANDGLRIKRIDGARLWVECRSFPEWLSKQQGRQGWIDSSSVLGLESQIQISTRIAQSQFSSNAWGDVGVLNLLARDEAYFRRAADSFNRALAINPEDSSLLAFRGVAFMMLGEYQKAIADFQESNRLDPSNHVSVESSNRLIAKARELLAQKAEDEQLVKDWYASSPEDFDKNYDRLVERLNQEEDYDEAEMAGQSGGADDESSNDQLVRDWYASSPEDMDKNYERLLDRMAEEDDGNSNSEKTELKVGEDVYVIRPGAVRVEDRTIDTLLLGEGATIEDVKGAWLHIRLSRNGKAGLVPAANVADFDATRREFKWRVEGKSDVPPRRLEDRLALARCERDYDKNEWYDPDDFTEVITTSPTAALFVDRGRGWSFEKDSIEDFDRALQIDPKNVDALYWRGETYLGMHKWKQALADFDAVLGLDPQHGGAFYGRALARCETDSYGFGFVRTEGDEPEQPDLPAEVFEKSKEDINAVIKLDPKFFDALLVRARLKLWLNQIDAAVSDAKQGIRLDPGSALEYTYLIAEAYTKSKDYDKAIEAYDSILSIDAGYPGTDEEVYFQRAWVKRYKEDFAGAEADFRLLLQKNAENVEAYFGLGQLRTAQKDFAGAIPFFDKAIHLVPDATNVFYERAWAKYKSGDNAGAIEDYTELIRLDPQRVDAYCERGFAEEKNQDYGSALRDYNDALKIEEDSFVAQKAKSFLLSTCPMQSLRDADEALRLADAAIALRPGNVYAKNVKACALAVSGRYDEAIKLQKEALEDQDFQADGDPDGGKHGPDRIAAWEKGKLWFSDAALDGK